MIDTENEGEEEGHDTEGHGDQAEGLVQPPHRTAVEVRKIPSALTNPR